MVINVLKCEIEYGKCYLKKIDLSLINARRLRLEIRKANNQALISPASSGGVVYKIIIFFCNIVLRFKFISFNLICNMKIFKNK